MKKAWIDYYNILGLEPDASTRDIEMQYREIMKYYSPENHPGKRYSRSETRELEAQKSLIYEAYQTLKHPESREQYDELYKARKAKEQRRAERKASGETVWKSLKRQYQEVKQEEEINSFYIRHNRLDADLYNALYDGNTTKPMDVFYRAARPVIHTTFEGIYQIKKLKHVSTETWAKYLMRNRTFILCATISGTMIVCGLSLPKLPSSQNVPEVFPTYCPATPTPRPTATPMPIPNFEPKIVLNRNYTIAKGDTLSRIATEANSSVSELKKKNNYTSDKIYYGRKMWVPYTINKEDIEYYTSVMMVNGYDLQGIARLYETDIETLCQLNPEAIMKTEDGSYVILSNSVLVPRFPTKQEVLELKRTKRFSEK